jgi:hypothetical protein
MRDTVTIEIQNNIVRLKQNSSSHGESAVILGKTMENGFENIYLDRRIHSSNMADSEKVWNIHGPYSTILSRPHKKAE